MAKVEVFTWSFLCFLWLHFHECYSTLYTSAMTTVDRLSYFHRSQASKSEFNIDYLELKNISTNAYDL